MEDKVLSVGVIYAQTRTVVAANLTSLIVTVIILTGVNVLADLVPNGNGLPALTGFASLIAQYSFFRRSLDTAGYGKTGGFGSFWWMNIISMLALIVAVLGLVLPAFYLAARWAIAAPLLMTHEFRATEALGESWRLTRASAWPLLGFFLLLFVPVVLLAGGAAVILGDTEETLSGAIAYPFVFAATALSWCVQLAAFHLLTPDDMSELEEVFA
jgi:hypothetical protein